MQEEAVNYGKAQDGNEHCTQPQFGVPIALGVFLLQAGETENTLS